MLKIVHLIATLEGGGAERQLMMLAIEQAKRGYGVHVALRRGGPYEAAMRNGGVIIHQLGNLRSIHPLLIARVGMLMQRVRPDILHTWLPQMDIVGGIVSFFSSVPWVLSERTSKSAYESFPVRAWLRCHLGNHAWAVVANSVEGARYWQPTVASENVVVVDNAVDVDAIQNAPPMPKLSQTKWASTILSVGRLAAEKAPEILVQAMMRLPKRQNVGALLIGEGPLSENVRACINKHGLEERVKLLSYETNWWGVLNTASALVSMSRFEGHPNVVLEAMAARCPVIVSDIPAHRAILDARSALIVPLDDPDALANAIAFAVSAPAAARWRAARAFQRVSDLTIETSADRYEDIYGRLLKRRSS